MAYGEPGPMANYGTAATSTVPTESSAAARAEVDDNDVPAGETLLGLYEGVPLTERTTHYGLVLPDKITIFQQPIEDMCASEDELRAEVAHTVVHEFAHFFGISDERLHELGAY